jgi:hypothetical protein
VPRFPPEVPRFPPEALRFPPEALRFPPEALRFRLEALRRTTTAVPRIARSRDPSCRCVRRRGAERERLERLRATPPPRRSPCS